MRTLSIVALLAFVLLSPAALAHGKPQCTLKPGLYEQLLTLDRQYADLVGSDYIAHRKQADAITAHIRSVDQQYSNFVELLCSAAQRKDVVLIDACCAQIRPDPIVGTMCSLASYIASGRKTPDRFLAHAPKTAKEAKSVWYLDRIPPHGGVGACAHAGPAFAYMDEIFSLARHGNRQALERWLALGKSADGYFAEYLDRQMITLLTKDPDVAVENWNVLRGSALDQNARDYAEQDERHRIILSVRSVCSKNENACNEIINSWSRPE
ncbi:MAG: hypothetical protein ACREQR_11315 [Candidatus Binataceae bacterium]